MMSDDLHQRMREHVERWQRAGRELEEIRERELRDTDTREAVRQLFDDTTFAQNAPRLTHSGLIEQQALFAKLRDKSG